MKISKIIKDHLLISGLWAIVSNAGIAGPNVPVEWCSKEDFIKVYSVNTLGMTQVTRVFLDLVKKEKGRIVNMSSIMGQFAGPCLAPYAMSKHAVEAYSDCLRLVVHVKFIE